jgi:hypothetical protein
VAVTVVLDSVVDIDEVRVGPVDDEQAVGAVASIATQIVTTDRCIRRTLRVTLRMQTQGWANSQSIVTSLPNGRAECAKGDHEQMSGLDKPPTQRFWLIVIALLIAGAAAFFYMRHEMAAAQLRKDCQTSYSTCPSRSMSGFDAYPPTG